MPKVARQCGCENPQLHNELLEAPLVASSSETSVPTYHLEVSASSDVELALLVELMHSAEVPASPTETSVKYPTTPSSTFIDEELDSTAAALSLQLTASTAEEEAEAEEEEEEEEDPDADTDANVNSNT